MNPALVCIPTYNERDNVESIVRAVVAADPRVDVLVVDDASPDGTGALADALARESPRVHVLHRAGKAGLGKAYLAAFDWALQHGYSLVLEMDADWSHDPRYLPTLLDRASSDADLVLWESDPFDARTRPANVWISGREVDLTIKSIKPF